MLQIIQVKGSSQLKTNIIQFPVGFNLNLNLQLH